MNRLTEIEYPKTGEYIDIHTHSVVSEGWGVASCLWGKETPSKSICSIGMHPWYISPNWETDILQIRDYIKSTKLSTVVAIGEIGLDSTCKTDFLLQEKVFRAQLDMAEELQMPVVLHCVKSFNNILPEIKKRPSIPAWIFHWYSGSEEIVSQLLKYPCYFSFGKDIVQKHTKRCKVLQNTPLDRVFFETDDWEGSIKQVYQAASEVLDVTVSDLLKQTSINLKQVLHS